MSVVRFTRCSLAVAVLFALAWIPLPAAPWLLSIKVLNEAVPPGGVAQMKVVITEPKPISTGRGGMLYDGFDRVDGIALVSPADDTFGVARVLGHEIDLGIVSTTSSFGTNLDYPVLTIAGRVPGTTPLGSSFLFEVDPASLDLRDATGAPYDFELKPGTLTVQRTISIDDVKPGSADLPAGAIVRILGTNLTPGTEIRLGETTVASQRYIGPNEIDIVLGSPARMHGMRVRAKTPSGDKTEYYSYARTARDRESSVPAFVGLVPVFPRLSAQNAHIVLRGDDAGIGLQNIGDKAAIVTAELLNTDGIVLSTASFPLGADRYLVRSITELFRVSYAPDLRVRVSATRPIQAMGIAVDAGRHASPIPAR